MQKCITWRYEGRRALGVRLSQVRLHKCILGSWVHQRLLERMTVQKQENKFGPAPNVYVEEQILEQVEENPGISSRLLATANCLV